MIETYEYGGYWWLPNDERTKLSDTLEIAKGKAKLDVPRGFERGPDPLTVEGPPIQRILGLSTTGKAITLESCGRGSWTVNYPVGAWFSEDEEITFDEIAFRTSALDTWAMVSGISQRIEGGEQAETGAFAPTLFETKFEPLNGS
jgi:hypothetical protein